MKPTLALSTYCLTPGSWEEAFAGAAALGYRALEWVTFCHGKGDELATLRPATIAQALRQHRLQLVAIYPPPLDVHNPESRRETLAGVRRAVDWAGELGCPRIVFSPLLPRAGYDYAALAEDVRALAGYIGDRPVVLALENHAHWPLSTAADFQNILDLCGADRRIALTLDTGHTTAVGENPVDLVRDLSPRIAHLHLKDHRGPHCVPFGTGETDLSGVLQALEAAGYGGAATVEIELDAGTAPAVRNQALVDARGWFESHCRRETPTGGVG